MNKGFTLVEIISVIVLLSLLVVIFIPTYSTLNESIKTSTYNSKINAINSSTLKYASTHLLDDIKPTTCKENCEKCYDLYSFIVPRGIYLTDGKDLDDNLVILDPRSNEKLDGCVRIRFNLEDASLEVEFEES